MKNKFYVIILLVLTGIIATTSFIPSYNNSKIDKRDNLDRQSILTHPEAGHIESIGS